MPSLAETFPRLFPQAPAEQAIDVATPQAGGGMDVAQAWRILADLRDNIARQFPNSRGRLEQLDSHLSTVAMVVGLIFEEAERARQEEAQRGTGG